MSKWGGQTDRTEEHYEVWVSGGSVLALMMQSEDLKKSKATFSPVLALALQRVSSSYHLSGKLSPRTQSAALSVRFLRLELWRNAWIQVQKKNELKEKNLREYFYRNINLVLLIISKQLQETMHKKQRNQNILLLFFAVNKPFTEGIVLHQESCVLQQNLIIMIHTHLQLWNTSFVS